MRGAYLCQRGRTAEGLAALRLARASALQLQLPYEAAMVRLCMGDA